MTPLLDLRDVRVHFQARAGLFRSQEVRALDGVDLTLDRGETIALVGESGSGKTTLARVALGLQPLTAGHVSFGGAALSSLLSQDEKAFRRRVQVIFQDPFSSLDPYLPVRALLEEPLEIHGLGDARERAARVARALDEVRLTPAHDYLAKYPHTLSGGQRQRVGIARALLLDPVLLVADEPVSMVDASSRMEVLRLLKGIQNRRDMAILYITHDLATARHFAHRTAVMYMGRIVEEGPTADVIGRPLHPYTAALVQSIPTLDPANRLRARSAIAGDPPSPTHIPAGCRFHPRCPRFMAGRCDTQDPALHEHGHRVACLLYEPA